MWYWCIIQAAQSVSEFPGGEGQQLGYHGDYFSQHKPVTFIFTMAEWSFLACMTIDNCNNALAQFSGMGK
jgi:hypothetical protein